MQLLSDLITSGDINRIIVLLLENRSFDHMLGYLSLPKYQPIAGLDGLRRNPDGTWPDPYHNSVGSFDFTPFQLRDRPLYPSTNIPAHECDAVAVQIRDPFACGPHDPLAMKGFAYSYYNYRDSDPRPPHMDCVQSDETTWPESMGYYTSRELQVTDFLARNFLICDRWFAPLPSSTQPNRLMAMSGYTCSRITGNSMAEQTLVYDWLGNTVPWGVFTDTPFNIHFFSLMNPQPKSLSGQVHGLDDLPAALQADPDKAKVFFLEPHFTFQPTNSLNWALDGNDNHPPTPVSAGESLLKRVWGMVSAAGSWEKTVLFITNDEHGGFFDHVSPLQIQTDITTLPGQPAPESFYSTGVRVPGLVVSPWVAPGVCHTLFDHTSILRLLVETLKLTVPADAQPAMHRQSDDGKAVIASAGSIPCLDKVRTGLTATIGGSPMAQGFAALAQAAKTSQATSKGGGA